STSRMVSSTAASTRSRASLHSASTVAARWTTTSMPSFDVANSPSKVLPMVSVRIIVPAMKATPSTTARPVSAKRTLWAHRPLYVSLIICACESLHAVADRVGGGVLHVVDDPAGGEERDAVGVRRGDRVVGDHHDGLAELVHGGAHEREDLGAGAGVEVARR